MKKVFAILVGVNAAAWAALNVPLTVQEALYSAGPAGVNRSNEPFCMGVPIPDSSAITSTGVLTLTGASAGQFRVTESWPDGNAKWIKVCGILPSLTGGSTATVTLTDGGSGNFGGSNIASGSNPITVNTGAMTATIKDTGHFDVLDTVTVGSTQLVTTGSSMGMVITGPSTPGTYPNNVTCGTSSGQSPCTNLYTSSNDPNSSCSIEENGPVMAVLRCIGTYKDASGDPYMHFTVRETFFAGESYVKVSSILRNADWNSTTDASGNTFDTAAKGMQGNEIRVALNPSVMSGTLNFTIAANSGTQTGTLNQSGGTDQAYIYEGQTANFAGGQQCAPHGGAYTSCANAYTTDQGWKILNNSTSLASSTSTIPAGWSDLTNSGGAGLELGFWFLGGFYPASLEYDSGGDDVRVGLYSARNSNPIYMAWTKWERRDAWLNFHASALSNPATSFMSFQAPLIGRAAPSWYNQTGVLDTLLPTSTQETTFWYNTEQNASPAIANANCTTSSCIADDAVPESWLGGVNWNGFVGGDLQNENGLKDLELWLKYGYTGRYLDAVNRFQMEGTQAMNHSDGTSSTDSTPNHFLWSSYPLGTVIGYYGQPYGTIVSANTGLSPQGAASWSPQGGGYVYDCPDVVELNEHAWCNGLMDYYAMTGDESIHEMILAFRNSYNLPTSFVYNILANGYLPFERSVANFLRNSMKLYEFLSSTGDSGASAALADADEVFSVWVTNPVCVVDAAGNHWPTGCTPYTSAQTTGVGVSPVWGGFWAPQNYAGDYWCGNSAGPGGSLGGNYRILQPFMQAMMVEALLKMAKDDPTYGKQAGDLAYGVAQFMDLMAFKDDGTGHWYSTPNNGAANFHGTNAVHLDNGMPEYWFLDEPGVCPAGTNPSNAVQLSDGNYYDPTALSFGNESSSAPWSMLQIVNGSLSSAQLTRFQMYLQKGQDFNGSVTPTDIGDYSSGDVIARYDNPSGLSFQDIPFTVTATGSGNYNVTFTAPSGTCTQTTFPACLRIKYSTKGTLNAGTGASPSTVMWLGYNNITGNWTYNPATYVPWFAASAINDPAPTPGVQQTVSVSAGTTGLTAANFSVRVMAPASGGQPAGSPAVLSLVSGNAQTGATGQALATPFTVAVTDANGNPVSGVTVTFAVTAGGGSLSAASVSTSSSGLASTTLTLGANAGTNTVTATSGTLAGSPVSFSATGTAAPTATTLSLVSGNGQTGTAGQALANPFVVEVTNSGGSPVSGVTVTFAVTAGGGSLSATTVSTNSSGLASTTLTLGPNTGTNTVTATSGSLTGSPLTFSATATAASGPTTLSVVSGNGQAGGTGQSLANPFVVEVTNSSGSAVSGVTVTFAITAGAGSLSATTASTNSSGLASTTLTLGPNAGTNTVTATSGALAGSPVTFTTTGLTGQPAATITWTRQSVSTAGAHPDSCGYLDLWYDPLNYQTIVRTCAPNTTSGTGGDAIYGNHDYGYNPASSLTTWVDNGGSDVTWESCVPALANQPPQGHVAEGMAVDTKRNYWWLGVFVMEQCEGSSATISGTTATYNGTLPLTSTALWNSHWQGYDVEIGGGINVSPQEYLGTSSTSLNLSTLTIGNTVTFTTNTALGLTTGYRFKVEEYVTGNWNGVVGAVSSDSGTTLVLTITDIVGTGTYSSWGIATLCQVSSVASPTSLTFNGSTCSPPAGNYMLHLIDPGTPATPLGPHQNILYYKDLSTQTWHLINPPHTPAGAQWFGNWDYDPGYDVLVSWGYPSTSQVYLYCFAVNTSIGCSVANDWNTVTPACNGSSCVGSSPGPVGGVGYYGKLNYMANVGQHLWWGGMNGSGSAGINTTFWLGYNTSTSQWSWTQKCAGSCSPPPAWMTSGDNSPNGVPATAYIPSTGTVMLHIPGAASQDWEYSPTADSWTQKATVGGAVNTARDTYMSYNVYAGTLVVWQVTDGGSPPAIYTAPYTASVGATSIGPPADLVLVSGNGQTGTVGQSLGGPFNVQVTDANGNPISGATVTFAATAGGGSLSATTATTNGWGLASTTLTLGPNAGTNTVTATSGTLAGSPVTFSATATAAPAAPGAPASPGAPGAPAPAVTTLSLVSGSGQTGTAGQALANPLVVEVTNSSGSPVSGVTVTFAVTAGGGSLSATTVSTNSSGLASTTLTLGLSAGTNTVTASSGTLAGSPITFSVTAAASAYSPCDLNYDGVVNVLDVQLAIDQALAPAKCTNADLQGNGQCTVVDVQRIINASLGQACLTGP
jgi:hypothetical protein